MAVLRQSPDGFEVPEELDQWLENHWQSVRTRILHDASRLASDEGDRSTLIVSDVSTAAMRFAPGRLFPDDYVGFWTRLGTSLTAVTITSAVLAIVFGFFYLQAGGLCATLGGANPTYRDMMKLFAGAIVGSTGAGVVTTVTRGK
jgi:hypothetical protein